MKTAEHSEHYPLVSVVIPSYNHAKFVQKTLLSVVGQTYPRMQIIVVDDASLDSSPAIISEFAKANQIEVVLRKQNGGLVSALNEGLALAKGKYVAFLASDDFWESQKIEKQVAVIDIDEKMQMVFTEGFEVDEVGNILAPIKYTNRKIDSWYFEAYAKSSY